MSEDRLAALEAREAIRRLISAYCDAVSRRDADAAGALFAPDARVRIADFPELHGRAAIVEGMRSSFAAAGFLHQRCDDGLIDVAGDHARARLGVIETVRKPDADEVGLIHGIYEDRYVRMAEGWRFAERRYSMLSRMLVPALKVQDGPVFTPQFLLDR